MSIYRHPIKRAISDDDVTQSVRHGAAPTQLSLGPAHTDSAQEWAHLRKTKPVDYMLPLTMKWLGSLPEEIRPLALVKKYARIANLLALDWNKPVAFSSYLHSLLVDHSRGRRQGFPLDAHRELQTLRDYYQRTHSTPSD